MAKTPIARDIDDFLHTLSKRQGSWTRKRDRVVLGQYGPYSVSASLHRTLCLQVAFTFNGCSEGEFRAVRRMIVAQQHEIRSTLGVRAEVPKSRRQICVIGGPTVLLKSQGFPERDVTESQAASTVWIERTLALLQPMIDRLLRPSAGERYVKAKRTAHNAEARPEPKSSSAPPSGGQDPHSWPVSLTPAAPRARAEDPPAPAVLAESPRAQSAFATAASTGAKPTGDARQRPACPICEKQLPPGRIRHQQCEAVAITPTVEAEPDPFLTPERARYLSLVIRAEEREGSTADRRRSRTVEGPVRLAAAREAVLVRSRGRCENPGCTGQPQDVTVHGEPILEVDHVEPMADGGRDHPEQMVALCPNCHAVKTRGSTGARLQAILRDVAHSAHKRWTTS